MNPGRSRLAAYVALAYTLVIVYASLQPFSGWRIPPDEVYGFLTAPWPRYITTNDIVLNVAAYLPFGTMLYVALRRPAGGAATWLLAGLLAGLLSLALESMQMFLPSRIASNLDLLANTAGAALGALAAWLCTLPQLASHPLAALRRRVIRADLAGDCGLIALAVWLFIQFDQSPMALASGDLREALGLKAWFAYAPASYQNTEMCIAALATLSLGLLAAQIATSPAMGALTSALTLALTGTAKSAAMWSLTRSANPFQWLTPGVMGGLLLGIALLALLIWLPSAWRSGLAILCVIATVVMVNLSPENPYQAVPPFLLVPQPTHLSSFSNIVRALSQLWPFATILLLLALTRRGTAASFATGNSA